MNSLTRHYRRSQLTALPMPGGRDPVPYCYAENLSGDREPVTHDFADWAVGDWRREVEAELCANSTDGSETTGVSPFGSSAGSRNLAALSTCVKGMRMSASVHSNSFSESSGR